MLIKYLSVLLTTLFFSKRFRSKFVFLLNACTYNVCDFGSLWRCSTTDLEIAHAKMGSTNPTPLTPIFACAILGMVHARVQLRRPGNRTCKMGGGGVVLVKPIFVCVILVYCYCFNISFEFRMREFLFPGSWFTFCITSLLFARICGFNSNKNE